MNIPKELLIDVGLNVGMSMVAGAAWAIIFSMFRRPRQAKTSRNSHELFVQPEPAKQPRKVDSAPMAFVNLRQPADTEIYTPGDPGAAGSDMYRRNRSEVMRMAREMLAAGSSREGIRRNLPISEGELAMLANR